MHRILAIAFTMLLAACSTMGTPSGPSGRGLDALHDDVGSLLVAFDLPRSLGPAPSGQLFTFDVANGGAGEHLRADGRLVVELGDDQEAAVQALFEASRWGVEALEKDYSGRTRILIAKRLDGTVENT